MMRIRAIDCPPFAGLALAQPPPSVDSQRRKIYRKKNLPGVEAFGQQIPVM
jgi:hypothetical protein